jgi:hypothetical protein
LDRCPVEGNANPTIECSQAERDVASKVLEAGLPELLALLQQAQA